MAGWPDEQEEGRFHDVWRWPDAWPPPVVAEAFVWVRQPEVEGHHGGEHRLEGYATPEGNLVLLVSTKKSGVLQRFVSQRIIAPGGIELLLKVFWNRASVDVVLGHRRLESLQRTGLPLII